MEVIIVPFDYKEESNFSVVPICIGDIDSDGNPIYREWVERGVVPVADQLRRISKRVLNDVWRVSELTERSVHSLSWRHGRDLGDDPTLRVLKLAHWYAEDLRVGGRRVRRKTEVELLATKLETLQDQFDLVSDLAAKDTLDRLMEELDRQGLHDIREMVPMMLRGCDAREFVSRFQKSRNTLSQRFYRGMRRAASAAGITW
jgi:hypothetical protein